MWHWFKTLRPGRSSAPGRWIQTLRQVFDTGLDVFIVRKLDPISTARAARRIISRSRRQTTRARAFTSWHDQFGFSIQADPEVPIQIDGEALGSVSRVQFTHHPNALRVVASL